LPPIYPQPPILPTTDLRNLVGTLPADIQNFTLYVAGIPAVSKRADGAQALISFLSSPAAQAGLEAKGFEPL
jgi:molybdate transport system substrate-binding protein